jgi:hypothetical protein
MAADGRWTTIHIRELIMKARYFLSKLALASVAVAWMPSASADAPTLDQAALRQRVVGNTIRYQGSGEVIHEYLAPDGSIHGESSVHGKYLARWRLHESDLICFQHDDPMQSGCVAVVLKGTNIEYHRRDGVIEGPFVMLPGNPKRL